MAPQERGRAVLSPFPPSSVPRPGVPSTAVLCPCSTWAPSHTSLYVPPVKLTGNALKAKGEGGLPHGQGQSPAEGRAFVVAECMARGSARGWGDMQTGCHQELGRPSGKRMTWEELHPHGAPRAKATSLEKSGTWEGRRGDRTRGGWTPQTGPQDGVQEPSRAVTTGRWGRPRPVGSAMTPWQ